MDANTFTSGTRRRTIPPSLWNEAMIASEPPPRVSGASVEMAPPMSAPMAGMAQRSQGLHAADFSPGHQVVIHAPTITGQPAAGPP